MLKNTDLLRNEEIDLKDELMVLNPQFTPISSLVLQKSLKKAKDVVYRQTFKTLSDTPSGGRLEGAAAPNAEQSAKTTVENFLEIFSKAATVSGTASAIYGEEGSLLKKEIKDRLTEVKYDIEKAFTIGVKKDEDVSSGRQMNGLVNQVHASHVIDGENAGLTTAHIDKAMEYLYTAQIPGERYVFINPTEVGKLAELYTKQENVRINLTPDSDKAGIAVNKIVTNFGDALIVKSNAVPVGTILVASLDYVEVAELRAPKYEPLAKSGDAESGQVVAELTIVNAPKAMAKIVNFI